MQAIDLHVHSSRSDGTFSPSRLVDYAGEKGLTAFALTDHDTVDTICGKIKAVRPHDLRSRLQRYFRTGVLLICLPEHRFRRLCRSGLHRKCPKSLCRSPCGSRSHTRHRIFHGIPGAGCPYSGIVYQLPRRLLPEAAERICGLQGQPEPENVPSAYRGRNSGHV